MNKYVYKPTRFYIIVFALTWAFWITGLLIGGDLALVFMLLGLLMPGTVAVTTVLCSKNDALKLDLKRKLVSFYRLKPLNIIKAIVVFIGIVCASIAISLLFGGSTEQFAFTDGFSFSIGGASALLTILLASVIEEIGWRGYGEDSVAAYHSWFTESIIFGFVWSLWHLPLFFIAGTYHCGLRELGILYMLNFLISVVPLGFITTWVYVRNNRSMLACIIFHLFVNTMQEKIAMTAETKCIETLVVTAVAVVIVLTNKDLFFEKDHIGNLLDEE